MKTKTRVLIRYNFVKVIILLGLCLLTFTISKSRTYQFFGGITARAETKEKFVALTFDDAPSPHSDGIVALLEQKQVRATFYMIGQNIERYPEAARTIIANGNEPGNHTYSHRRMVFKSWEFIDREITKTDAAIIRAGYRGPITFRPPNGKKLFLLPWYLSVHGRRTVTWDVEPDSYVPRGLTREQRTEFLVTYTLDHVRPGSIILIHPFCDTCESDRDAVGPIIDMLKMQGYTFVTVSDLLTRTNIR